MSPFIATVVHSNDVKSQLIATIESNLSCQICMEMLLKPYGRVHISPCSILQMFIYV